MITNPVIRHMSNPTMMEPYMGKSTHTHDYVIILVSFNIINMIPTIKINPNPV